MANLKNIKNQAENKNTIGEDFVNTSSLNNNFDLFESVEEVQIKEKESISIKVDVELLDKLRAIAEVKNKTVLELLEILIEQSTKNIETQLPDYKTHAEAYKKRFEKRRGPRQPKKSKKK